MRRRGPQRRRLAEARGAIVGFVPRNWQQKHLRAILIAMLRHMAAAGQAWVALIEGMLDLEAMRAHLEDVGAGPQGDQGIADALWPSLLSPRKSESLWYRLFGPAPLAEETVLEDSDGLLGVRLAYDEDSREHLKTVELLVQRRSREREAECLGSRTPGARAEGVAARRVALRIGWRERDVRRVKSAGGRWDPVRRVWILQRDVATERIPRRSHRARRTSSSASRTKRRTQCFSTPGHLSRTSCTTKEEKILPSDLLAVSIACQRY